MLISTSILNARNRNNTVIELNNTDTDYIHIDVMDGIFVSNKQFTCEEIRQIALITKKPLDVHLMVNDPKSYIKKIKDLPHLRYITIHSEIMQDLSELLEYIKENRISCGLSIKPETPFNKIIPYLSKIDLLLLMSVQPGKGGQAFIDITSKIKQAATYQKDNNFLIEVDGGINNQNISLLKNSGAQIAVVGSYITSSNHYQEPIELLKQSIKK